MMSEIFSRNKTFLDIMSLMHFASGIGIGLLMILLWKKISKKIFFVASLLVLLTWEFFESFLRSISIYYYNLRNNFNFLPEGWFSSESFVNVAGDMIIGFFGIFIVYMILKKNNKFYKLHN